MAERIDQLMNTARADLTLSALDWAVAEEFIATTSHMAEQYELDLDSDRAIHSVFAHPLLILCPPLGEWLHERTEP
jgi:hypothetical protein